MIREWAILVAAVSGAFVTLVAALGIWWHWGRRVQRWFSERDEAERAWRQCVEGKLDGAIERIANIERQVTVNGIGQPQLPAHQRGMTVADLLTSHIVATAPLFQRLVDLESRLGRE